MDDLILQIRGTQKRLKENGEEENGEGCEGNDGKVSECDKVSASDKGVESDKESDKVSASDKESDKVSASDKESECDKDNNPLNPHNSPFPHNPLPFLERREDLIEIHTSQSDVMNYNGFKLDFTELQKNRPGGSPRVEDLKNFGEYKIEDEIYLMVKEIELFVEGVYRVELCDETGVIEGSSTVGENEMRIGSLVCLREVSLWKIRGNHLNIVRENVKRVVRY